MEKDLLKTALYKTIHFRIDSWRVVTLAEKNPGLYLSKIVEYREKIEQELTDLSRSAIELFDILLAETNIKSEDQIFIFHCRENIIGSYVKLPEIPKEVL